MFGLSSLDFSFDEHPKQIIKIALTVIKDFTLILIHVKNFKTF